MEFFNNPVFSMALMWFSAQKGKENANLIICVILFLFYFV